MEDGPAGSVGGEVEVAMVKFAGAKVVDDAIDRANQVHGALGFSTDLPRAAGFATAPTRCTA